MFNKSCNIDTNDRINRTVIGVFLLLATLIGVGRWFYIGVSLILIVEGLIGWCSIPILWQKIKKIS